MKTSTIWLNGEIILAPGDCPPRVSAILLAVKLQGGRNELQVRLTGKPGDQLELWLGE